VVTVMTVMTVMCWRGSKRTQTTTHTTPGPPSSPRRACRWHAKYTSAPAGSRMRRKRIQRQRQWR
jgi:hypothetical protein